MVQPGIALAITSAVNRLADVAPGTTATVLCTYSDGRCLFGDPNAPIDLWTHWNLVAGGSVDAMGRWYYPLGKPTTGCPSPVGGSSLLRWGLDGSQETVLTFMGECDSPSWTTTAVWGVVVDAVNGTALLEANSWEVDCSVSCDEQLFEIIAITGLPKLIDTVSVPVPCPDADADGFRDCTTIPGCFPYGGACGDCDDSNALINPRKSETKPKANRRDGKDNDCNGVIDR
jgi:hypothetical protein